MVDITYTATAVTLNSGPVPIPVTFGGTVTAGQPLYFDSATNTYKPTDADTETEAQAAVIALTGGASGQRGQAALPGSVISYGSGLTKGTAYFCSTTPGGIAPAADLGAGDYPTFLGIARSTALFYFYPVVSGVTI